VSISADEVDPESPLSTCPECNKPLDRGRCWRCDWRLCQCGRETGSAFIAICIFCGWMGRVTVLSRDPEQKEAKQS